METNVAPPPPDSTRQNRTELLQLIGVELAIVIALAVILWLDPQTNLLRLFEFYLASMCLFSIVRRFGLYQAVARLTVALAKRYQRLLDHVKEQGGQFLTWSIFTPIIVTGVLWLTQTILTRLIFPHSDLTHRTVIRHWWSIAAIGLPLLLVFAIDGFFLVRVGKIDAAETEKYFHQAETWLGTWKSKAVRLATFGYVNPHKMVEVEVAKALASGTRLIHSLLWWTTIQTAARVLLGFALWIVWTVG